MKELGGVGQVLLGPAMADSWNNGGVGGGGGASVGIEEGQWSWGEEFE